MDWNTARGKEAFLQPFTHAALCLHYPFSFPVFADICLPTRALLSLLSGFWVMLFLQVFVAMLRLSAHSRKCISWSLIPGPVASSQVLLAQQPPKSC